MLIALILVLILVRAIVIAVIHLQLSPLQLKPIQVPHCRRCSIDVCVLEEAKALRFAGLFVVDEAERHRVSNAAEDLDYLLFAHPIGYVANEHHAPAFLITFRHARRVLTLEKKVGKLVIMYGAN